MYFSFTKFLMTPKKFTLFEFGSPILNFKYIL